MSILIKRPLPTSMFSKEIQKYLDAHEFKDFSPRAVFFDMDGVLFDSMPNHASSWSKICTKFGLDMSPEEAFMHEGRTGEATINILTQKYWNRKATAEEVQQIYEAKCQVFNACPEPPKMPGATQVLQAVKEAGLAIYVVTGSGQLSLLNRLATHFPGLFVPEHIISSKHVKYGKPHPEPYLMALEKAAVHPWEAIVIENAPLGVQAATAAQIFTVAVNTGPLPESALIESGTDLLFPSMTALAEDIKHLLFVRP